MKPPAVKRIFRAWALTLAVAVLPACAELSESGFTLPSGMELLEELEQMEGIEVTPATPRADGETPETIPVLELPDLGAEVLIPDGNGPYPAVVLIHGGAWMSGSPSSISTLASHLSEAGFLTVNARYKLSNESPGFPQAVDDIACAVRYAASHPDSDGTVAIVGHSAGAHIGALVALTGDLYGGACPYSGPGLPQRFVGLAGPYDANRLGLAMIPFFGVTPTDAPETWRSGNPQALADLNPTLRSLIVHGELDHVVDTRSSRDFHQALTGSGADSALEILAGVDHIGVRSPAIVGDLIVAWLQG